MRKLIFIFIVTLALSCETEIYVSDESGPVPVVYCILNQDDTIQSLRLSKSYLSQNADIPPSSADSLLIDGEVGVTIETVENSQVTAITRFFPTGISKDSGFFPNERQWIYQGNFRVKEKATYRLIIEIKSSDYLAYSSFKSLGDFSLVDPAYPEGRKIHLVDDHNPLIHWTKSENAAIYQVGFRLHFKEIKSEGIEDKSITVLFTTAFRRDDPGAFYSYTVNSNQFYKRLSELIPSDSSLLRQYSGTDVFVIAGSESVGFYLNSLQHQDPFQFFDYKNIINGQGIFGSLKTAETKNFKLDKQSIDSLAYGSFTKQLNFLDSDGHRKN